MSPEQNEDLVSAVEAIANELIEIKKVLESISQQ